MKLLWDFTIQTDRHLLHHRPNIVCQQSTQYCISDGCSCFWYGDSRLAQKVNEKYERPTDLKIKRYSECGICVLELYQL